MKRESHFTIWSGVFFAMFAACSIPALAGPPAKPAVTPDRATQRVLEEYGVSTTIVRPWDLLKDIPAQGDKGFPILLQGQPSVHLILDRDYWALAIKKTKGQPVSYILNPKDEQSALNISVGEDGHDRSDADLAKAPGFSKIKRESGTIATEPVIWRRWSDQNHLYSDCSVLLPAKQDNETRKYRVRLKVTANTQERRKTLEDHLKSLQLIFTGPDSTE
jgi:hypothetical protein